MTDTLLFNRHVLRRGWEELQVSLIYIEIFIPYYNESMAETIQKEMFKLSPNIVWNGDTHQRLLPYESELLKTHQGHIIDRNNRGYIHLAKDGKITYMNDPNCYENITMPKGLKYLRNAWRRKND